MAPRQLARHRHAAAQPARDLGPAEDFIDQERADRVFFSSRQRPSRNEAIAELQALRVRLIDLAQELRVRLVLFRRRAQLDGTCVFGQN